MIRPIPVNQPDLNGNEKKYLIECIESGWISSDGPFVKKFEDSIATYLGRKHGISVSNGTVALELAMAAAELQPGDEVILPTFTIISCVAAVIRRGCVPVLVDSHPVTWNMDVDQIEAKITTRTKAIMVVHLYGLPVDIDAVLALAKKYALKIIEDSSQMLGQRYQGKPCGSFGELSTLSFYANKHVTTGEGGMVLTNDDHLAERCRSYRNLCFQPKRRFVHEELGYNFRMTNLQAALGLAQFERLNEFIVRKRHIGLRYTELLSDVKELQLPLDTTDYADNIYWVFGIVLKEEVRLNADQLMHYLSHFKIESRPFFWPMHEQPVLRKMGLFVNERYPVAEQLARNGCYVPSGMALTEEQIVRVAHVLKKIFGRMSHD